MPRVDCRRDARRNTARRLALADKPKTIQHKEAVEHVGLRAEGSVGVAHRLGKVGIGVVHGMMSNIGEEAELSVVRNAPGEVTQGLDGGVVEAGLSAVPRDRLL